MNNIRTAVFSVFVGTELFSQYAVFSFHFTHVQASRRGNVRRR
jgi:hypothetical protein